MEDKDIQKILRAKLRKRRELAKLPFDKKIEIIVHMQKIVRYIRKDRKYRVWQIT
jgi:hypothetical protein